MKTFVFFVTILCLTSCYQCGSKDSDSAVAATNNPALRIASEPDYPGEKLYNTIDHAALVDSFKKDR